MTTPHPFTLRQLQYVLAVADTGSFRRAAELCHVSQPALSAQIAQVEDLLGVVLFERDRRGVLVTPDGAVLIARMRRLIVDADDLVAHARRAADPFSGPIRLGVIPTVAPYLLPTLTPALRAAFPKLVPIWTEEKTPTLVQRLAEGALDGVLLALEAEIGDLEHATVLHDPFVLAMASDHPLTVATGEIAAEILAETPMLLLDEGHCFRTQALAWCAAANLQETAFRATSLVTLAQMVAGGAGATLLPWSAVDTEARRAGLAVRTLAAPVPYRTIILGWRPRSPLGEALRVVATAMRAAVSGGVSGSVA